MSDIRSRQTDTAYLLKEQYNTADNLTARARLHEQFSTNKVDWLIWLFEQFDFSPDAKIIEFGCGPAWLWAKNLAHLSPGWDITLTDFSPGMVAESQRNLAASTHPFKFEVIDIQSIPYEDARFDAAVANHMLYHVPDLRKALSELRRILKPNGKLYTATNGEHHLREIFELLDRFDPDINYWEGFSASQSFQLDNGVHILSEFFSYVELRRQENALEVTQVEPLVAYMLSGRGRSEIVGDKLTALHEFLQRELDQHGCIHITKDAGLLISSMEAM